MPNKLLESALAYANSGLYVFPLAPRAKEPRIKDWPHKATTDPSNIREWWTRWPDANIGIHVGRSGLVVLDVDPRNGGTESLRDLMREYGEGFLSPMKVNTGGGGSHHFYAHSGPADFPAQIANGIDLKSGNGYIVAPPSVHASGNPYEFDRCTLLNGEVDFLPPVPPWFADGRRSLVGKSTDDWVATCIQVDPETPENVERVRGALEFTSADCSRDDWRNTLFAIMSTGWGCAKELAREWSISAPDLFEEAAFLNVVDSAKADRPNGITLGSLFATATANGWKDPRKKLRHSETYGDLSNGRRLAERFRGRLLYVHASGLWHSWDGLRWAPCERGDGMQRKREQAESQLAAVAEAEDEAQAARDALKTAQGDAFIADQGRDLTPYTSRLSKAEKRLASANDGAALARAALPRIEGRTVEIDAEIAETHGERAERVASWWTNRARIADRELTACVSGLAAALRDRIACDTRTRGNVGMQLLQKMQGAVHVPVMGRYTEAVNWHAWFGYEQLPDVAEAVDRIDGELQTAIADEG